MQPSKIYHGICPRFSLLLIQSKDAAFLSRLACFSLPPSSIHSGVHQSVGCSNLPCEDLSLGFRTCLAQFLPFKVVSVPCVCSVIINPSAALWLSTWPLQVRARAGHGPHVAARPAAIGKFRFPYVLLIHSPLRHPKKTPLSFNASSRQL